MKTGNEGPAQPRTGRAALALSLAALFWAGNFVAGRALRGEVDPVTLNVLRWALCLGLFLPLVGRKLLRHGGALLREWRLLAALGATGIAGFHTMVYAALAHTTAINALLILSLAPIAILAGAALSGLERPGARQWLGSLVSLGGAGVLVTGGEISAVEANPGDLWMIGAVLAWAAYSLLLRRRPADLPGDVTLAGSILAALALLLPLLLLRGPAIRLEASPGLLAALAYIAVFASLVAFLLWSWGVDEIGPSRAGQFIHLMPVFGAGLAVLLLGERIGAAQAAGAALVALGLLLMRRPGRETRGR